MSLPTQFAEKFKTLFSEEEYKDFIESFSEKPVYGIRYNPLKIDADFFRKEIGDFEKVPWCSTGYYYPKGAEDVRLSVHPYYHAGLYYIQDPSAMFPAECLRPERGECVLDLCAAPGGKTLQLAEFMENKGFLVANEISPKRTKALLKNIELMGIKNTTITTTTPEKLLGFYGSYFDRVLVDAPCSGEGMFRREPKEKKRYETYSREEMTTLQQSILATACDLVRPGGFLVYSTCTFSPEENEGVIDEVLSKREDFTLLPVPKVAGISDGRRDWVASDLPLEYTGHFFSHKVKGEGHFVALMQKKEDSVVVEGKRQKEINFLKVDKLPQVIQDFWKEVLEKPVEGFFYEHNGSYFLMDEEYPVGTGLLISKVGTLLGEVTAHGFKPSQQLIMSLRKEDVKNVLEVSLEDRSADRYLKGETLSFKDRDNGWYGVFLKGFPLGWGKIAGGIFKNQYPKGWRKSY